MNILGNFLLVIFCLGIATTFSSIALCDRIADQQVQQTFDGSVVKVNNDNDITFEMVWVRFYDFYGPAEGEIYLNWEGENQYQVIDPTERLPDKYEVYVENTSPFEVETKFALFIDGVRTEKLGGDTMVLSPGMGYIYDPELDSTQQAHYFSVGEHTTSWLVQARRAGSGEEYTTIFSDSQSYGVYTPELNAFTTSVEIVQRSQTYEWLTGTLTSFIENVLQINPNEPIFFRFHLQNDGDEPVCMNIAHQTETGGYEPGFFVDGTLITPFETDIMLDPGDVAVVDTQTIMPIADVNVDAFVVLAKAMY